MKTVWAILVLLGLVRGRGVLLELLSPASLEYMGPSVPFQVLTFTVKLPKLPTLPADSSLTMRVDFSFALAETPEVILWTGENLCEHMKKGAIEVAQISATRPNSA